MSDEEALLQQPKTVVGYQFSPSDGRFIGEYEFPNNLDRIAVHLPPHTTLTAPGSVVGMTPYWTGGAWEQRPTPGHDMPMPPTPYPELLPEYIEEMKRIGLHGALIEDQIARGHIATRDETALSNLVQAKAAERSARDSAIASNIAAANAHRAQQAQEIAAAQEVARGRQK